LQERVLSHLAEAAQLCTVVERQLAASSAPELETLIKLHRVMILKLSLEANAAPELLKLVAQLMKPVMDWARLQEKCRELELAEQKYRDQVAAQKATEAREASAQAGTTALTPETLAKIERELNLF